MPQRNRHTIAGCSPSAHSVESLVALPGLEPGLSALRGRRFSGKRLATSCVALQSSARKAHINKGFVDCILHILSDEAMQGVAGIDVH